MYVEPERQGPTDAQIRAIYRKAREELAGLNRGRDPVRFREWKAIWERFGIRLTTLPPALLPQPAFFYDYANEVGDLFLPRVHNRAQLQIWVMHEMIEFLYSLEFCSAFQYYPWWGTDHDMATLVHEYHTKLSGYTRQSGPGANA